MKFGDNLKKLRKTKKLSQEDLAEKLNVSRQSVSKWETGDAYPEMNNLLELCKVFHCKINDLVNDSIIDIDSLGENVKKEVISLKQEEQNKMKGLSKAISVLAKIIRIVCLATIPLVILGMISIPFIIQNVEVKNDEIIWKANNEHITLERKENNYELKMNGTKVADMEADEVNSHYVDMFKNNSKISIIGYAETGLLTLLVSVYLMSLTFKHLSKLFKNLNIGETPFTLENVHHIKKMAWLMIAIIILPNIGEIMFNILLTTNIDIDLELFDLLEILFLFSLSYVFEYGRLIQVEAANGKIYGGEIE